MIDLDSKGVSGFEMGFFFFICFFKKLLVSSECLLIYLKPDRWVNKTLQDLFCTDEQPQITHQLFDASDLSKSNMYVTFKMFLKYQDGLVGGK